MSVEQIISYGMGFIGVIGTGLAIYQFALLKENKKRKQEIQFLLAGISNLALSKSKTWDNQLSFFPQPQDSKDLEVLRSYTRARDDLIEIRALVSALEGSIDPDSSAITSMMEHTIKQGKLNHELNKESIRIDELKKKRNE